MDCFPCLLRQALEAARFSGADADQQTQVMQAALGALQAFDPRRSPPEMAHRIHHLVARTTGNLDPYRAAREQSTREALKLYPRLRSLVLEAHDPLETAVRLSIAGNIIDVGVSLHYDLEATIQRVLAQAFDIKDLAAFRERVPQAKRILFLADNAGETVFDRVLIETLGRPVTYVVKGGAILNDAIRVDALAAGLGEITTLVDNGSNAPGTVLDACSPEFQRLLAGSEVIIAKGQANYETLSHVRAPLFFLLQAKCSVVAQHLGVAVNSIVLKQALQT